jgi:hypothetical protein
MEYFARLDVSMAETHVCVMHRDGAVVYEVKVPSTPADIAAALAKAPACGRIVFETGRLAPMRCHGLSQLGLPIFCIESRQAHQTLKSLATHKTGRNDARGLAYLARTGFFKPVYVKSLPAHALRSLIIAQEAGRCRRRAKFRWRARRRRGRRPVVSAAPPSRRPSRIRWRSPGSSIARKDLGLAVERQVVVIFRDDDMSEQPRPGTIADDCVIGGRCGDHRQDSFTRMCRITLKRPGT